MKYRILCSVLILAHLLSGCAVKTDTPDMQKYQTSYFDLFDTVTTILGYAESEEAFLAQAQELHDDLAEYHQLYDIYNDYPGMNNIKTVNDRAGFSPVEVDRRIIGLLQLCREFYDVSGQRENAAMGSVLQLWHEAREFGTEHPEEAYLPDRELLQNAAEHTDFDNVIIDEKNLTVFLADPELCLDVGSVAKGYAVTEVCRTAPSGYLISIGGNVFVTGPKASGSPWIVGLTDPDGGADIHSFYVEKGSVVTSGDYQRFYTADGENYHHIIDPDTLMPGSFWRSVTVFCDDSGIADALSTSLFLMSKENGEALLTKYGAEAFWIGADGQEYMTEGLREIQRT
ncbi:MAG: FAD:protein FMN transferase [Eubacteriales bacterium]|nr:FAD:protein FMN transferase [Eubacteriales bacterium]